jgi:hypothetical protein
MATNKVFALINRDSVSTFKADGKLERVVVCVWTQEAIDAWSFSSCTVVPCLAGEAYVCNWRPFSAAEAEAEAKRLAKVHASSNVPFERLLRVEVREVGPNRTIDLRAR